MKFDHRMGTRFIFLLMFIVATTASASVQAQIVINEVVSSNATIKADSDGAFGDWFELYNAGSSSVNLNGYTVKDGGSSATATWTFPSVDISADSYLLVWCDDKNRGTGPTNLHTSFKLGADGDTLTLRSSAGGTVVDSVTISALATDESYSRFPNASGTFKKTLIATPLAVNRDSSIPVNSDASLVVINEVVSSNISGLQDEDHAYLDWIELYNTSETKTVNLNGLRLADPRNTWIFPNVSIGPRQYLVVFGNDTNNATTGPRLHTSFDLSNNGEELRFLNTDGSLVNNVVVPAIAQDTAYARIANGTGAFKNVTLPTPGAANQDPVNPPNPNAANIVINEVVSNNGSGLHDEDNIVVDWIELYNKGTVAVDMQGLKLADSTSVWAFPIGVTINPGQYLIVLEADSNDSTTGPRLHTNFGIADTGEQIRFLNKDDSLVDSVTVPNMTPDTSYGREPNGTGTFRMFTIPTPEVANTVVACVPSANANLITINEVASDNETVLLDEDSTPQDWIELYNKGNVAVNLNHFKLRDATDVWSFPAVTLNAGQYLIVFASDKNRVTPGQNLHTNFKLESNGETLQFLNDCSVVVDTVVLPQVNADSSYARLPNATGAYRVLTKTTPRGSNVFLYGDVNLNGQVTAIDASLAARNSVGLTTLTAEQIQKADVNGVSGVTAIDASLIARKSVGSIPKFPVEP